MEKRDERKTSLFSSSGFRIHIPLGDCVGVTMMRREIIMKNPNYSKFRS